MVEKNREIKLTNRDNGTVGYTIPDLNLHRTFSGGETKTITFEELENPKENLATRIYSSDGQLLGTYFRENRSHVCYDSISPNVIDALIATEDVRFYEHCGIDFKSLPRVFKGIVTGNSAKGGGSTISQQLAKMLFPRQKMSKLEFINRKFQEWVIFQ